MGVDEVVDVRGRKGSGRVSSATGQIDFAPSPTELTQQSPTPPHLPFAMSDDQPEQSTSTYHKQKPEQDKTKARDKGANKGAKKHAKQRGQLKDEPEELNRLADAYVSHKHQHSGLSGT